MLAALSLIPLLAITATVLGDSDTDSLYGTWTSKSHQVFTGPGFYDPVDELLIEPSLPGYSLSFTKDGYFEEAAYRVSGNPQDPSCPTAVLIYQHGTYTVESNGSLILAPFEVDGRQLLSDPCKDSGSSVYSRYNQTVVFKSFLVKLNDYHGVKELVLHQFDGAVMMPMYLAYQPPVMLPTITLNPTKSATSTETGTHNKRSLRGMVKRGLENRYKTSAVKRNREPVNAAAYWWTSLGLIALGSAVFFIF
ncbi:LAQU0S09e02278g1_1 [Lachancea quebecensis]|uniref:Protein ROT1 n=1 Tax=Lachancea quebecensis TaxID=1654605 RepID=A0A0P1KUC5_9SACH|nr:LAQU0S09e02278g1_1 [Lachancea quebecensis]